MKIGRPSKANTIYKVSIHNNCGRKYASTQPFTVDENGKKHYSHKHWGIVDYNMKFHPNSTYFYASLEERRKLIFPSDWDLSEIEALSGTGHRGVIEYNGGDLDRMYDPTWFLDNVALIFNELWRKKGTSPDEDIPFVRAKGLEPIRLTAPDPKSGLATNYNTPAPFPFANILHFYQYANFFFSRNLTALHLSLVRASTIMKPHSLALNSNIGISSS